MRIVLTLAADCFDLVSEVAAAVGILFRRTGRRRWDEKTLVADPHASVAR